MKKLNPKGILSSLIVLGVIFFINSCKSVIDRPVIFSDCNKLSAHLDTKREILSSMCLKQNFEASIFNNGKETRIDCRLLYLKDSCIIINLLSKSLGVEISRIKITKDSLVYLNRLKKEYFSGLLSQFKVLDSFIIQINMLKAIMLGQCSLLKIDSVCTQENLIALKNNYFLSSSSCFSNLNTDFKFYYQFNNKAELESLKIFKVNDKYFYINFSYSQFINLMDIPASMKIDFRVASANFVINVLSAQVKSVDKIDITVNIPKSYKPITLD